AELRHAIARFNEHHATRLDSGLYTVADLCGVAAFAATAEDYLIPSSILGATISGLVSRSILNADVVGPNDFHGCLYYEEFAGVDLSRWFVDEIEKEIGSQNFGGSPPPAVCRGSDLRQASTTFLAEMQRRFGVSNLNYIKPGIGEATRVLLRRVPDCVMV